MPGLGRPVSGMRVRPAEQGRGRLRCPNLLLPTTRLSGPRRARGSGRRRDASGAPHTVGVFGGSGFIGCSIDVEEVAVATPYGPPSAHVRIGEIEGTRVAFMPRHGDDHELPPHRINYRANVWAMRELGVTRILGPCACGSLKPELSPGTFMVADQFVDRTRGREDTFYDGPQTTHVAAAEPYRPSLREVLVGAAKELEIRSSTAARWW